MLTLFKQGLAESKKERKTNDILEYIRSHWSLFSSSKHHMDNLVEEMEQQQSVSLDLLADMLELPKSVLFMRTTKVETAKAFLHPLRSTLYKKFQKAVELKSAGKNYDVSLCIFFVAGDSTIIMTNMDTRTVEDKVHLFIGAKEGHRNVHIFKAADAPLRLPELFKHEGEE